MNIPKRVIEDIHILMVQDNFVTPDEIEKYFDAFLANPSMRGVVLNFSQLSNLDSVGIGGIVTLFQLLEQVDRKMIMCEMNDHIKELFNIIALDKIIQMSKTEKQAIEQIQQTA